MYGLPKTHKSGTPLRPIVSSIGTYNYELAKYLVSIIKPVSRSIYCIKDSFAFAREIAGLQNTAFMCSFDVKSLFTNVPLMETIDICIRRLFQDRDVVEGLNAREFRQLLIYATRESHFLANGIVYDQADGVAMGSPLGPVLADMFMSDFEEQVLADYYGNCPTLYRRYVDDTFLMFDSRSHALDFFKFVNERHPSISFTMEEETDNSLSFLDVLVRKVRDVHETTVYRKPTFSGLYQRWDSFTPKSHKLALVNTLLYRAWMICSNLTLFHIEASKIKSFLRANGYPAKTLDRILQTFLCKRRAADKPKMFGPDKKRVILRLPFLGNCSSKLRRQIQRIIRCTFPWIEIRIIFVATSRLSILSKLKDSLKLLDQSRIVYRISCSQCQQFYIGKTVRRLSTRMKEHQSSELGPVHIHLTNTGHQLNLNEPKVLARDQHDERLLIKESLLIREHRADQSLNANVGSTDLRLW